MAYNPIRNFYINPDFAEGHFIQWQIDPVFTGDEPFVFVVQVSQEPLFSEIEYTIPAGSGFWVRDVSNHKQAWADDHWYRLKMTTADKQTFYSKALMFGASMPTRRQWAIASEIQRKELLRMKKFTGGTAWLLKRRNYGKAVKASIDPISGVPLADNTTDYGVGIDDGYFDPIEILVSYEEMSQNRKQDPNGMGVIESNTSDIRMIGYPIVEVHDVIVDGDDDRRYIIKEVKSIPFPATDVNLVQELKGLLLTPTDPIYKIKVKIGPEELDKV